ATPSFRTPPPSTVLVLPSIVKLPRTEMDPVFARPPPPAAVLFQRTLWMRYAVPSLKKPPPWPLVVLPSSTRSVPMKVPALWMPPPPSPLVRGTGRRAVRTSLTWGRPSARLPAGAAKCRRRDLVVFVFGADIRVPLRRVALAGARDLRGLVRRPSRGK